MEPGWPSGPAGESFAEWDAAGAALVGRRTWSRSITGAVIITVSRSSCPATGRRPLGRDYRLETYVTDGIASAMAQAKAAAGDRDVPVQGAYTAQRALEAGVLDELHYTRSCAVRWWPSLFEVLPSHVELKVVGVIDTPEATHIRYRVGAQWVDQRTLVVVGQGPVDGSGVGWSRCRQCRVGAARRR